MKALTRGPYITPEREGKLEVRGTMVPQATMKHLEPESSWSRLRLHYQLLRRWKWTLVISALLGIAAGLLLTLLLPPLYQAQATLEVQGLNDNFLDIKQVVPVGDGNSGPLGDLQTQIKILQSDAVVDPIVSRIAAEKIAPSEMGVSWIRRLLNFYPSPGDFAQAQGKRLKDSLDVRAMGQTRIIQVSAESSDPRLATGFINQLCDQYITENINARWEMSQRTNKALEKTLEETRVKLRESEDALQAYARQSGLVFTAENRNITQEKLSEVQGALSKAQADRMEAQSRFETVSHNDAGLPDEVSHGSVHAYEEKLADLQRQRAELATTYTSDYGKVRRLDAQIASMQTAIQAEKHDVFQRMSNQYRQAVRNEKLLSDDYASASGQVSEMAKRSIQYNILEHELEGNRQIYDEMLKQVKRATIASAVRASNARVLDKAEEPLKLASPNPILNCALGFLVFSFMGVVFSYMRDRADSSLREPGEGFQLMGVPELGFMLHEPNAGGLLYSLPTKALPSTVWSDGMRPRVESSNDSFLAIEACRAAVTSLLLPGTDNTVPRLMVVTSPGPQEGKTTVAANLAMTMALMGRKVLLIDADLRRPRLPEIFGLSNDRGLSTILEAPGMGVIEGFFQKSSIPQLSVLTSGPWTQACANLLHSRRLADLLRRLRGEYDCVLIDTPPMLPVADARVIGRISDGVILVVRAGHTTGEAAAAAHQRLADDGTPVLGLLLNDWNPTWSAYTHGMQYAPAYAQNTTFDRHDIQ